MITDYLLLLPPLPLQAAKAMTGLVEQELEEEKRFAKMYQKQLPKAAARKAAVLKAKHAKTAATSKLAAKLPKGAKMTKV